MYINIILNSVSLYYTYITNEKYSILFYILKKYRCLLLTHWKVSGT